MSIGFVLPYAYLVRIKTTSGQVYGFCSLNFDFTYDGINYTGAVGTQPTTQRNQASLAVDNLEIELIKSGLPFNDTQVTLGLLDNADVRICIEDLGNLSPVGSENIVFRGFVVRIDSTPTSHKVEMRSYASKLNAPAVFKTSSFCRYEVGETGCGVNLAPIGLLFDTLLSSVTTNSDGTATLVLSTPINAGINTQRFIQGTVTVTSGNDFKRKLRIIDVPTNSTVVIKEPPPFLFADNPSVQLRSYCDRTQTSCVNIYDNLPNFGGFLKSNSTSSSDNWMVGLDRVVQAGGQD